MKNISDRPLTATPRFLPVGQSPGTPFELPAIALAPGQAVLVDAAPLVQLAAHNETYQRVSVHVRNSGEKGSLIGSLASFDRRDRTSFEIPLRDSGSLRNSGGSYPIRLDDDYSTYVSIMNVSNEMVEFVGVIRHSSGDYTFRPAKLLAGETTLVDIRELRDSWVPDSNGATLPADFTRGQFNWSMYRGGTVPKLVGRSQIVSLSRGISASYSCPVCCPNSGPTFEFNPFALLVTVDGFQNFGTNWSSTTCYGGIQSWPGMTTLTPSNPAIATSAYMQEGQAQAYGHATGATQLTTEPYWRDFYLDDGMDCYYYPYVAQDSADVDVNPTVTISSFAPNPILLNTTASAQVSVSPPAPITLQISSSGTGRATFTATGTTTMQIQGPASVNIRGDAASSSGAVDLALTASHMDNPLAVHNFSVTTGACSALWTQSQNGGIKNCPSQVQLRDTFAISQFCDACQFTCQVANHDSSFSPGTCASVTSGVAGSGNRSLSSTLSGTFAASDCDWHNVMIRSFVTNAQGVTTQHIGGSIGLRCNSFPGGAPCP